jgi:hypothetical protein
MAKREQFRPEFYLGMDRPQTKAYEALERFLTRKKWTYGLDPQHGRLLVLSTGGHWLFHDVKNLHQCVEADCERRRITECVFRVRTEIDGNQDARDGEIHDRSPLRECGTPPVRHGTLSIVHTSPAPQHVSSPCERSSRQSSPFAAALDFSPALG